MLMDITTAHPIRSVVPVLIFIIASPKKIFPFRIMVKYPSSGIYSGKRAYKASFPFTLVPSFTPA